METPDDEIKYFLVIDGQQCGPYPFSELIDAGMEADSLVWWEGLESWPRAGKIPKLAALLEEDRRKRQAARRAARLPEPDRLRWLGRAILVGTLPTAALFFIGGTSLMTCLVLWAIATNSSDPPGRPQEGLMLTATVLFFVGLGGSVLGMAFFFLEAVFIIGLVRECRAVVLAVAPIDRSEKLSRKLFGLSQLLIGPVIAMPSLPDPIWLTALTMRGGPFAVLLLGGVVVFTLLVLLAPVFVCLMKPELGLQVLFVIGLVVAYAAIHIPVFLFLFFTVYRTGFGLNHVIDMYRLKVPWAPIGLGFWTAVCGMLLMLGPFSLAFFIVLAIWARQLSVSAAMICDTESRERIAVPLPKEPSAKAYTIVPEIAP